jgi:hypothetical protein
MLALRILSKLLVRLTSSLKVLPRELLLLVNETGKSVLLRAPPSESALLFDHDIISIDAIYDAAMACSRVLEHNDLRKALSGVASAAQNLFQHLKALDTTTSGEIVFSVPLRGLNALADIHGRLEIVEAPLARLQVRISAAMDKLKLKKGPDRQLSVSWLVNELCNIWAFETGEPITNSAIRGGRYLSSPQSDAGKFILAAVQCIQPLKTWKRKHKVKNAANRALFLEHDEVVSRMVYYAMRDYVARHQTSKPRPGRRKAATL